MCLLVAFASFKFGNFSSLYSVILQRFVLCLLVWSVVRDCGKLIQSLKERGIQQMCCFVILLLFNEMQISVLRFSAIPHLRVGL